MCTLAQHDVMGESTNAASKRYHKALPLMGATRLEAAEKSPDAGQGKLL